ncbi:neurotactin isoform X2 [Coccinella septempunctata]|nr:neurotactin isoform X2 [Coccinella septempunctata]
MSEGLKETDNKSDDKKKIEAEEMEQIMNVENKEKKIKSDNKEGMEVKPKKIPIGGIQMPGFFTRSKSKEKCKDDDDQNEQEEIDLRDQKDKTKEDLKERTVPRMVKLPNPFRKSKLMNDDGETISTKHKSLLNRLSIGTVIPGLKKDSDNNLDNQGQAGLASIETLDEKSGDGKSEEKLKAQEKDVEKQASSDSSSFGQFFITYKYAISGVSVFLLFLIIILIVIFSYQDKTICEAPVKDGKYVMTVTSCGRVEGLIEDSAVTFRGIPYARPPVGNLRFEYAQPLNNINHCWNGTLIAHNATDNCLQIHSNGSISGSEDCLTLDVVTPYVRYDNPLPVIVLIGAESLIGDSPGKMRPSARYARSKDVVFVRPNFRLGVLGFLALDILSNDEYPHRSGNYGLSDILEALKWVQLNIEHFGGDPNSVTLFGYRAGATLVTSLASIRKPQEYFTRAWASSGSSIYPKKSRPDAENNNRKFLEIIQCDNVECLRKMDAEKLLNAVEDTWRKPQPDLPHPEEDPSKLHEWLVLDGDILQEHPATVLANEDLKVQLVIGSTAHAAYSEKLLFRNKEWTEFLVKEHINMSLLATKNLTNEVTSMYPMNFKGLTTIISDIRIVCPLLSISSVMRKVPFYVVTQTRGEQDLADIESDVDAILGRYEPKTPEQRRYVSAMQGLFYHFVWHGKIEQQNIGHEVLIVGQDVLPNSSYSKCDFWTTKNFVPAYAALD